MKSSSSGCNKDDDCRKHKLWCWTMFSMIFGILVVCMVAFTIIRNFHSKHHTPQQQVHNKYADALQVAMHFFDIQKSGKLVNNKIGWRGDSGLEDGIEVGADLSKGMYDAGDLIKFGFPMAFTATMLSWAILEYGHHMNSVNQLEHAQDSLIWITDYLISAHPSQNLLYIQVGDPKIDHACWQRPESMTEGIRGVIQVNTSFPGTEVAAETAAAMAAASLVLLKLNSTYSDVLLNHAQQLFSFADTYRGSYSISFPEVQDFYNSSGYGDELLWAASWLFLATQDTSYLKYVTVDNGLHFANWGMPDTSFSWDNKLPGVMVLLSRVDFLGVKHSYDQSVAEINMGLQMYRKSAEMMICELLPDSPTATTQRTNSGLIWVTEWNSLLHPVSAAFLTLVYSDYMILATPTPTNLYCGGNLYKPSHLRDFAISQVDYVLGENPMKISYLVGYGEAYPLYVHHKGASIPVNVQTSCEDGFKWLHSPDPNPNTATGALVGGPFLNDSFIDHRENWMQCEPTTYNTALIVALLSGLVSTTA